MAHPQHFLRPHHVAQTRRDLFAQGLHYDCVLRVVAVTCGRFAEIRVQFAHQNVFDDSPVHPTPLPQEVGANWVGRTQRERITFGGETLGTRPDDGQRGGGSVVAAGEVGREGPGRGWRRECDSCRT
jgi:hypothetical protein